MRIVVASIPVDDQAKALAFYTEKLGFRLKRDLPAGEFRWLTLVSPVTPDAVELLLEPLAFPPSRTYQQALFAAGIPVTLFAVDDIQAEYDRLLSLGVAFRSPPAAVGGGTIAATLEDGCGNLIRLVQMGATPA